LNNVIKSGIASQLMKMCIEHACKVHVKEIILEVNRQNNHAIGLYKKFSFIYIGTKGEEHIMKLAIG
jgi:ribosomal protein S18 acetylase RimI-like enzyme